MKIGILSDTHDDLERTERAVDRLIDEGVEALFHCGDLNTPRIVSACAKLPFYFVFGNHDADMTALLKEATDDSPVHCLEWGGVVELAGKRIAMAHGHLTSDLKPLIAQQTDYLLFGHFHFVIDYREGPTRRINPGALFRAETYTVVTLDLATDDLRLIEID